MKGWEVMRWAFTVPVDNAAQRSVLTAYAWRAGPKLLAWPGLEQLEEDTRHYRETISIARRALVGYGYLVDTGERRGISGRVHVYRLDVTNMRQKPLIDPVDKSDQSAANAAHCGEAISGFSRRDKRQKPQTIPISEFELVNEHVQRAQAREHVQGAEAPPTEQVQGKTPRGDGLESPIDQLRRSWPHLANILPPKDTP